MCFQATSSFKAPILSYFQKLQAPKIRKLPFFRVGGLECGGRWLTSYLALEIGKELVSGLRNIDPSVLMPAFSIWVPSRCFGISAPMSAFSQYESSCKVIIRTEVQLENNWKAQGWTSRLRAFFLLLSLPDC